MQREVEQAYRRIHALTEEGNRLWQDHQELQKIYKMNKENVIQMEKQYEAVKKGYQNYIDLMNYFPIAQQQYDAFEEEYEIAMSNKNRCVNVDQESNRYQDHYDRCHKDLSERWKDQVYYETNFADEFRRCEIEASGDAYEEKQRKEEEKGMFFAKGKTKNRKSIRKK